MVIEKFDKIGLNIINESANNKKINQETIELSAWRIKNTIDIVLFLQQVLKKNGVVHGEYDGYVTELQLWLPNVLDIFGNSGQPTLVEVKTFKALRLLNTFQMLILAINNAIDFNPDNLDDDIIDELKEAMLTVSTIK